MYPTYETARGTTGDLSNFFLPILDQENLEPLPGVCPDTSWKPSMGSMLLYVYATEHYASALEMNAIGGKNVANLAVDFVKRRGIALEVDSAEEKRLN